MLRTKFSPLNISGLQLWLDGADTNSMYDATSGGSLVTDGNTVARWQDKSGNGRHATQSTANNRPTLNSNKQNGLPCLTFDGSNDSLATASFAHSVPLTLYVVRKNLAATPIAYSRIVEHGANNGVAIVVDAANPQPISMQYASSTPTRGGKSGTNLYLLEAYVDSSATRTVKLDVNGANDINTTRTGTPTTPTAFTISNYGGGGNYYSNQDMHEIVYYNRLLSAAERTVVRTYLNTKWKVY